ncbi:hypothetical protein QR680_002650 [Steinernema hermaphroditum]|uniref:C-type lectin domain-containing protein n=1 Tax=Steinernema hermaphroditum TaxID=289476 RepID=A0AA39LIK6_9BILA|nr:hypothetical protein QR680_002650 [Steinernema hermaphroditum]
MLAVPLLFSICLFLVKAKRSAEIPDDFSSFNGEVSRNYGNSWIAGPNDKQYQFHIGVQSWITAREYCLTQESDLLTISSPEELKWVLSHYSPEIKSHKERLIQVGAVLDDSHGMREWKWVNGEELNATLTPWKSGEPFDHLNGRERCATISVPSKKLDDIDCDAAGSPLNMFRFVCERTNMIHEMHEINNNPLWRKVEDVLQYFGFGQAVNNMMKTLTSDEEDYWEEAKKEDEGDRKKSKKTLTTEAPKEEESKNLKLEEQSEKNETKAEQAKKENVVDKTDSAEQPKNETDALETTVKIVEVTETPSATVTKEETISIGNAANETTFAPTEETLVVNGTEGAQHDQDPEQHKAPADDEVTVNQLSVSSKKLSEELVAVDDPQGGTVMEVFETATPETDIIRTTRAESGAGKTTSSIEEKIQNIETMIHTVETIIGNSTEKNINVSDILEKVNAIKATTPSSSDEIIGKKRGEHFEGHCEEDSKPNSLTTEEKIEDFLNTLRTFLARNKLKDLNKIASAKNVNKSLIDRLKEAVQNNNSVRELKKLDESKAEDKKEKQGVKKTKDSENKDVKKVVKEQSDEVEKELTTTITEEISNSSAEANKTAPAKSSTGENGVNDNDDQWEVQHNEPFQNESEKKTAAENFVKAYPQFSKIDLKNPPVEPKESKQRQHLDTSKLVERIRQNELARKRISADRMESLAMPAPSVQRNVNAFTEMEKLFSDIGSNFRRFIATRM